MSDRLFQGICVGLCLYYTAWVMASGRASSEDVDDSGYQQGSMISDECPQLENGTDAEQLAGASATDSNEYASCIPDKATPATGQVIQVDEDIEQLLDDNPQLPFALNHHAVTLLNSFQDTGSIMDLEDSITHSQFAIALYPFSDATRSTFLSNLGRALSLQFEKTRSMHDLEEAISQQREALLCCPLDDPNQPSCLENLAVGLLTRFNHMGSTKDLEESLTHSRAALSLYPPGHPDRLPYLNTVADALISRFRQMGSVQDLEEVVSHYSEALELCPQSHPQRSTTLHNLAFSLTARFSQMGSMQDLDRAITVYGEALELCPPGYPGRYTSLSGLALALSQRFNEKASMPDLDEAISHNLEAVELCSFGHSDRPTCLNNLAYALITRFNHTASTQDLEMAIMYCRETLRIGCLNNRTLCSTLNNLAHALFSRFDHAGSRQDLDEAILQYNHALHLYPSTHPDRPKCLSNSAFALSMRFKETGAIPDLDSAMLQSSEALQLLSSSHPERYGALSSIALALSARFSHSGSLDDLEESIVHSRAALALCPLGHPKRSLSLDNLAYALVSRFHRTGSIQDLDEGIALLRETRKLCPPGNTRQSRSFNNLALALFDRFNHARSIKDLEEAISQIREALHFSSSTNPTRCITLNNLALFTFARFHQTGFAADLEEAISHYQEALEIHPPDHPSRYFPLSNLSLALSARFPLSRSLQDLEDSVTHARAALVLNAVGHPDRTKSLNNLACSLFSLSSQTGTLPDLEEVVVTFKAALDAAPVDHPGRSGIFSSIASVLSVRFSQTGAVEDLEETLSHAESASSQVTASVRCLLLATLFWLQITTLHENKHSSTLRAYARALYLVDRCLVTRASIESQHQYFTELDSIPQDLASNACAAAIDANSLELAVEFLEQGRAVIWSRLSGYRQPLENLRMADKKLASQVEDLTREIEHISLLAESVNRGSLDLAESSTGQQPSEMRSQRHGLLLRELDAVLEKIRTLEGFDHFMKPVPFALLREAANEGPVIIINVSKYRCDALIIREGEPPNLVNLSSSLFEDRQSLLSDFRLARSSDSNRTWVTLLRSIWELITEPVVERLIHLGVREQSRIWWCPTSFLCGLPLHAAGPFRPNQRNLPDIFISSYTTSLSSLTRVRPSVTGITPGTFLLVGRSDATLPNVENELCAIQKTTLMPVTILADEQTSRASVTKAMLTSSCVHFSCHSHQKPETPFQSYLELEDGGLTIMDIVQSRLPNAEFAFLSACHSAEGNLDHGPDETIHLAASMQFIGFRSVVGTLWPIADVDAPDVAADFYSYIFRDGGMQFQVRLLSTRQLGK